MELFYFVFLVMVLHANGKHFRKRQVTFGNSLDSDGSCKTPNGETGSCIPLHECHSLYSKFNDGNLPEDFFDFLRSSSHCGYEKFTPIVCCPDNATGHHTTESSVISDTVTNIPVIKRPITRRPVTRRPVTRRPGATSPLRNGPGALTLLPQRCGVPSVVSTRIIGAKEARKGSWPWIAALGDRNKDGHIVFFCGGVILTDKHILTAAHCLHGVYDLNVVRLGAHNLTDNLDLSFEDFQTSRKLTHEAYNSSTLANDIAILTLNRPMVFKASMKPACLPIGSFFQNNSLTSLLGFIAGWGSIQHRGPASSVLLETMVPIQEMEECKQRYFNLAEVVISDRQLCAGSEERDACQGDSGGPLMVYDSTKRIFSVAGIVSYGHKCAVRGFPGVYTRITSYVDWIRKNLN